MKTLGRSLSLEHGTSRLNPKLLAGLLAVVFLMTQASGKAESESPAPAIENATWIWGDLQSDVGEFRKEFTLAKPVSAAKVLITADNGYELYVNGTLVGFDIGPDKVIWSSLEQWDISMHLRQGKNVLGIRGISFGGNRGVIAAIRIELDDTESLEMVTDDSWRVAPIGQPGEYTKVEFREDDQWGSATALGPMGVAPWGKLSFAGSKGGRRTAAMPVQMTLSQPPEDFDWPGTVAFVADDCSIYKGIYPEAWGVEFRVGAWTRAYYQFDLPTPTKIGRKLCLIDLTNPTAEARVLIDAGAGVLGSPSVTYDGKSILFSMAPAGASFFHIYRVSIDSGHVEQLTDGPFHDIDPAELPDGKIVFASTRIGTFEEYHGSPSRALFVMAENGDDIESITHTPIFDSEPKVLADGRIAFVRSDNYFSRAKVETQIHAIMPDGTSGQTEIGCDVGADYGKRLRLLGYGSPAPLPDGRIGVISSQGNFVAQPSSEEESFQRLPDQLGDLAALPDGRFLATLLGSGSDRRSRVLVVIDPNDNRLVKMHQSETPMHSPVFVGATPRPAARATTIDDPLVGKPNATGFLYAQDVHITRKTKADWDQIRAIRVLRSRALSTRSSHWDFVHQGKEVIELGTVPIAPDGSFFVEVPADVPLALQAVDAEGRSELNQMSWMYVRPGEVRSCIGCHEQRRSAPPAKIQMAESLRTAPLKLLEHVDQHRWRGNNPGVSGMMDLQFERFRENASLNLYQDTDDSLRSGREEIAVWTEKLRSADENERATAANRLALFRDRSATADLIHALNDPVREVRVAAALALSACGTRDSVAPLIDTLLDSDPHVAQAAAVALENITAHQQPIDLPVTASERKRQAERWNAWLADHPWPILEAALIDQISSEDRTIQRRAVVALGHIGSEDACAALREYVLAHKDHNPYARFVNNNRTDNFTFDAASPLNPRTLQAATRSLGYLKDVRAVPILAQVLGEHTDPETSNLFLAEAAAEALGWIGTAEAESVLIDQFAKLGDYVDYVGWYSDHPALYACHSSPLHARILEALDRIGSTRAGPIVAKLVRSLPTDPDRALFLETDSYELLLGRVVRRSGKAEELIQTCLAILGDPNAKPSEEFSLALSETFNAWAGKPDADNRAAQLLSAVCRDSRYEPSVRSAYERYRAKPDDVIDRDLGAEKEFHVTLPQRHWVLFYLGRTLGNLKDPSSVETLVESLCESLNEARYGRPKPDAPNVHLLQLEPTPCWRGAAAWALGRIGDRRAVDALIEVVRCLDNAVDTRYAAAKALGDIADPESVTRIEQLADGYPEVSTRRALLESLQQSTND